MFAALASGADREATGIGSGSAFSLPRDGFDDWKE
jgi:hypothetical protein